MRISDADRCPKCGTPYLSMLSPGESQDTRYCYTCATNAADASMAARLHSAAQSQVDDELAVQPLGEPESAKKSFKKSIPRRGNTRQQMMSDMRNKAHKERFADRAAARKAASSARQPAVPDPAPPAEEEFAETEPEAAELEVVAEAQAMPDDPLAPLQPPAIRKSAAGLAPARRNSQSGMCPVAAPASAPSPVKQYATYGAVGTGVLVAAIVMWKMLSGSAPPSNAEAPAQPPAPNAAQSQPGNAESSAKTPEAAPLPKSSASTPKAVAKSAPKAAPDAAPDAAPAKSEPSSNPPAPQPKEPAEAKPETPQPKEPANSDVANLFQKPRRSAAKDDDDPEPAAPKKGAPKAATTTPENPQGAPVPPAAEQPQPPPKLADLITKKPEEAEAPAKPAPPAPVTATEPTLLPVDFTRLGEGTDKTFTQQLSAYCPGWTVRDTLNETSKVGIDHRGRNQSVILNPVNEKLPAKLMATLEIPPKFAPQRPLLRFEVSTKADNKTWYLTVKAANQAIIERQQIKSSKDLPWVEIGVPLARYSGQRVELVVEGWTLQKDGNKRKDDLCCFRNLRLEWDGKPKPPAEKK